MQYHVGQLVRFVRSRISDDDPYMGQVAIIRSAAPGYTRDDDGRIEPCDLWIEFTDGSTFGVMVWQVVPLNNDGAGPCEYETVEELLDALTNEACATIPA